MSTRGGTSLRVFDPSRGRSVVGARALLSRHPSPPRLWLFYVGWGGCRVWGDVSVACGLARPDATLFWPRVSSPLLSRVPSCRVPARRFKDPGGVALPPPGSGGGGARREVGRSGGSPSDSMTLLPPLPPFSSFRDLFISVINSKKKKNQHDFMHSETYFLLKWKIVRMASERPSLSAALQ